LRAKDLRGLTVNSIADGTHVGTVDELFLDLPAKHVVGFSVTDGVGPFGGARDNAPTVAVSGIRSLGPDAVILDDVAAAHADWVNAAYGTLVSMEELAGRKVVTEGGANVGQVVSLGFDERTFAISDVEITPGFLKSNTSIPVDQLVRIGPDVLIVADAPTAARELDPVGE
jgi:sporulation protein YlmC with PRC-barrel domain